MTHEIKSMLPGTFYRKPAPDQPNYKDEGDTVAEGDVIGLVEVMKTFHELKADVSGRIVAFKIDNEGVVVPGATVAEIEI